MVHPLGFQPVQTPPGLPSWQVPPVASVFVFTSDSVLATERWVLSVAVRVKLYSRFVANSVFAPMFRRGTPTLRKLEGQVPLFHKDRLAS